MTLNPPCVAWVWEVIVDSVMERWSLLGVGRHGRRAQRTHDRLQPGSDPTALPSAEVGEDDPTGVTPPVTPVNPMLLCSFHMFHVFNH